MYRKRTARLVTMIGAMIGAAVVGAAAAPASAESLQDALAIAYQTNPTIRAERARLRATEELKAQAWANALPQIQAEGSYSSVRSTQTLAPGFGTGGEEEVDLTPLTAGVNASQTVFAGFRNINAIRQARARARAGGAELAGVEQDILLRVATAYFDVVRDVAIYDANLNNVEVLLRRKREAEVRFRVGEITRTDVAQADARLAAARANLAGAQAQLAISRANYGELVGAPPGTLDPASGLPPVPDSLDAAVAIGAELAPAVVAANAGEEAARRQIAIAKGAFLPNVSLTAGYQYSDEPSTFIESDETFSYGARASMPIFLGGLNFSRVREARALHDRSRAQVEAARRRAEAAVRTAWERLVAAKMTIRSAETAVEANEVALEGVQREAQVGTRTTLDVLDAEQEFLNAQVSLANALRDEKTAAYSLLAAAGVLNLDAIGVDPASVIPAEE